MWLSENSATDVSLLLDILFSSKEEFREPMGCAVGFLAKRG